MSVRARSRGVCMCASVRVYVTHRAVAAGAVDCADDCEANCTATSRKLHPLPRASPMQPRRNPIGDSALAETARGTSSSSATSTSLTSEHCRCPAKHRLRAVTLPRAVLTIITLKRVAADVLLPRVTLRCTLAAILQARRELVNCRSREIRARRTRAPPLSVASLIRGR